MPNCDTVRFFRIEIEIALLNKPHLWWLVQHRQYRRPSPRQTRSGAAVRSIRLQGQDIGAIWTRDLISQRVIGGRQDAAVQRITKLGYPCLVKIMEDARIDFRPIMDGHDATSGNVERRR